MLNAAGKTWRVVAITVVTWVAQAIAVFVTLRHARTADQILQYSAAASAVALLAGGAISVVVVWKTFGARPSITTVLRVGLAAVGATAGGSLMASRSLVLTVVGCFVTLLLFLAILAITGEVGRADLAAVKKTLVRK